MIRHVVYLSVLLTGLITAGRLAAEDALRRDFLSPPRSANAWCYWWWLNGAASEEGITRDIEEMKKQGISGALLFDAGVAGPDAPRGPHFMSDAWRELYKHAVREADRCGIALSVNLCSGWNAGGPWVTPEYAAKKIVGAATTVRGPGRISAELPLSGVVGGFYRDIAVLGHPVPEGQPPAPRLSASSSYRDYLPALAQDGLAETRWISDGDKPGMGPTPEKPEYLQFDYDLAWPAAGLYLQAYPDCGPKEIEVQASADGKTYRPIKRATVAPRQELVLPFDEVEGKHFRVVFLSAHPYQGKENWNVQVAEIALLTRKQIEAPGGFSRGDWKRSEMLDLTRHVDGEGRLNWDAPDGTWQILRIGYDLHGKTISCVGSGPSGLEIDTMSAEAMEAHFAETGAKLIADAGPLAGKSLQYFHIDSWELGQPTWTPKMLAEFQKRRGYELLLFLPALLGRTVDDREATERFLADYRRTAADLVAENYYGRLESLTVQGGLHGTHPESGGPFFTHWIDPLQCLGRTAIPMGEFWRRSVEPDGPIVWHHNPSVKQAASAAHIYGKALCQAEAFTTMNACDWTDTPWSMKDIGDAAFCEGLTRIVLCFWVHQSQLDAKPGFQWPHVGTHFDSNVTWWPMADGWLSYLARCQHMLRQGLFVADFAMLQDEAIPGFIAPTHIERPAGFDYDAMNAEVLLTRTSAKDGRLTLPDGMSYRYLVLPHQPDAILSPATLKKVNQLAEAGVTVIGPRTLADLVPKMREGPVDAVTRADGLAPDVEFREASEGAAFDWIHRRDGETDIYFLSNQNALDASADVAFRVAGKQPELWNPVTGGIRDLPNWREEDGRTIVPLEFAPRQSWFVVFRTSRQPPAAGEPPERENFPKLTSMQEITGVWEVQFDPQWFYPNDGSAGKVPFDRLVDWRQRPEDAVRYYSGIATYRKSVDLPAGIHHAGSKVYLDLGTMHDIARVRLNGRDLGVVWTAPWRVEITGAMKPGTNDLQVDVANLWPNRLIGDATLPEEQRQTVTNVRTYDTLTHTTYGCRKCSERRQSGKPAELLPSGLLGPVTLQAATTE